MSRHRKIGVKPPTGAAQAKPPEAPKKLERIGDHDYGLSMNLGILDRFREENGTILPLRGPDRAPIAHALLAAVHSDPDISDEVQATREDLAQHATNVVDSVSRKRSLGFFRRVFGADK